MIEQMKEPRKGGFTIVELFVVIAIVLILIGIFLPAVGRGSREPARRTACSNNLRQFALAMLNYESANMHFPAVMREPELMRLSSSDDNFRLSGAITLLPFIECSERWNSISNPMTIGGIQYPALPSPTDKNYPGWKPDNQDDTLEELLYCPSRRRGKGTFIETSYAFSIGDIATNIHQPKAIRGANAAGFNLKLADVKDGASNTIGMAEIMTANDLAAGQIAIVTTQDYLSDPKLCFNVLDDHKPSDLSPSIKTTKLGRGFNWADGSAKSSMFNTILPPNSPNVSIGASDLADGFYSTASRHSGGINATRLDGSVTFVRDNIDTGDLSQKPIATEQLLVTGKSVPSPFGVWGAAGTIAGEEEDLEW